MELAQNFDNGKIAHSLRSKPCMKRSPVQLVTMLSCLTMAFKSECFHCASLIPLSSFVQRCCVVLMTVVSGLCVCRDIWETFRNTARLQQEPALVDFAELLALIAAAYNLREEGVLADVLSIYARIGCYVSTTFQPSEFP